jgi:hypothetical protein
MSERKESASETARRIRESAKRSAAVTVRKARLRVLEPALVKRTEDFVRSCIVDIFKQGATEEQISEIAQNIIANFPDDVKYGARGEHA